MTIATHRGIQINKAVANSIERSTSSDPRAFGKLAATSTVSYTYPIGMFDLGFRMGREDDAFAIATAKAEIDRYLGPS